MNIFDIVFSSSETMLLVGAVFAFIGIALGAFGAHILKGKFKEEKYEKSWETGCRYFMYNAFALLVVGLLLQEETASILQTAGILFIAGAALFSGSLWALSVTGVRVLGAITPIGGLLQLAGWVCLITYFM